MIYSPDGLMRYNNGNFGIVDDIPLLSQWIKKFDKSKLVEFFWQGQKDLNPRHPVLETGVLPTELYPYDNIRYYITMFFILQ